MSHVALIAAVAGVTYGTRISGLLLQDRAVPRLIDRFLTYVPVAVFAALITPNLAVGGGELVARLAGVLAATLVVLRLRQVWSGLAAGMAVYWLIRAFVG
jgi:branched-subunit amino acid transport protein